MRVSSGNPFSTFGLFSMTTFISDSHLLTIPHNSGPSPPWCWQSQRPLTVPVAIPKDAGYFCHQGFTPHQHFKRKRNGFPDGACLDRVPVTEHRVESYHIAASTDDMVVTTATCTTSCRTIRVELSRALHAARAYLEFKAKKSMGTRPFHGADRGILHQKDRMWQAITARPLAQCLACWGIG